MGNFVGYKEFSFTELLHVKHVNSRRANVFGKREQETAVLFRKMGGNAKSGKKEKQDKPCYGQFSFQKNPPDFSGVLSVPLKELYRSPKRLVQKK
jgi:hypothetical protein